MTEADRQHWEGRYAAEDAPVRRAVDRWLASQAAHIDERAALVLAAGRPAPQALDVACGAGGTLCWLAERGWEVTGVDISATALSLARSRLQAAGVVQRATLVEGDLDTWRPAGEGYDLVTCFYFLDRRLWPLLRDAVRPRGLLCLHTYHTGRLADRPGTNPAHLLQPHELEALAEGWGWRVLASRTDERTEAVLAQRGV
jgi:2-polyprenyl-3-methyl-5-hydroxy-6-metoxy-1,4-benzoquinol methylase